MIELISSSYQRAGGTRSASVRFTPKGDHLLRCRKMTLVPLATKVRRSKMSLFDYLVGGYEHGVWHDQRKRLSGLMIDDHQELAWLHDR